MVQIYSSNSWNMVKSYSKEEEKSAEKIRKSPCLYDKANERCKEKDRKKMHGVKFSLLNEIPNIHILFENVLFVKFGGNGWD